MTSPIETAPPESGPLRGMALLDMRPMGIENAVPPRLGKSDSYDSLSVARILQSKLDPTAGSSLQANALTRCSSPVLSSVSSSKAGNSPTIDAAASILRRIARCRAGKAKLHPRHSLAAFHQKPKQAGLPTLCIHGVENPVRLQSGASLQQLKLLSAAFKLCPEPTPEQLDRIATRVGIPKDKLEAWFERRRTLEKWISQNSHLQAADVASMYFRRADEQHSRQARGDQHRHRKRNRGQFQGRAHTAMHFV